VPTTGFFVFFKAVLTVPVFMFLKTLKNFKPTHNDLSVIKKVFFRKSAQKD